MPVFGSFGHAGPGRGRRPRSERSGPQHPVQHPHLQGLHLNRHNTAPDHHDDNLCRDRSAVVPDDLEPHDVHNDVPGGSGVQDDDNLDGPNDARDSAADHHDDDAPHDDYYGNDDDDNQTAHDDADYQTAHRHYDHPAAPRHDDHPAPYNDNDQAAHLDYHHAAAPHDHDD